MKQTKGEKTRLRILKSAISLINTSGYANTSTKDIIEASGVQKGNLYFHFSSKEELYLALIEYAKQQYFKYLQESMKSDTPIGKINDILDAVLAKHRKMNFVGGCIFGNMALEMSDLNPRILSLIREVFSEWEQLLAGLLHEAQLCGDLDNINPESMARFIVASLEGGIMLARVNKCEDDIVNSIDMIRRVLGINDSIFRD